MYKIRRAEIINPSVATHRTYLGISLNNPLFWKPLVLRTLLTNEKYPIEAVLVGDYLHRWNVPFLQGIGNPSQAAAYAQVEGERWLTTVLNPVLDSLGKNIEILRWEPLLRLPESISCIKKYRQLYATNGTFKANVDAAAQGFLSRQKEVGRQLFLPEAVVLRNSVEYILEEVAIFEVLSHKGYNRKIYPGKFLPVLQHLTETHYEQVTEHYKKITMISFSIKKN